MANKIEQELMSKNAKPTTSYDREDIIKYLIKAWSLRPQWRFGQLIANIFGSQDLSLFYIDNEEVISLLTDFINTTKPIKKTEEEKQKEFYDWFMETMNV